MNCRVSGVLLSVLLSGVLLPASAIAWSWQDLWKTPAQQLRDSEASGDYEPLLQSESPGWQGAGQYRNEDYAAAAETWSQSDAVNSHYNRGTALTRAGDFDAAIEAFNQVLSEQPEHESAAHNLAIAEQLKALQQQQQNGQNSDEQDSQQEDSGTAEGESESGQDNQDQQSQQQQEQQQQSGEQASSSQEQQNADSEQEQSQTDAEQAQAAQQQQQEQEQQQPAQEQQESVSAEAQEPLSEDQQATEQWLRRIPDDPTGLLRRKLIRSHQVEYPDVRNGASPW